MSIPGFDRGPDDNDGIGCLSLFVAVLIALGLTVAFFSMVFYAVSQAE